MSIFLAPKRNVKKVFIHCSDSDIPSHDDVSIIREWHVKERGFSDIGYHFFIKKTGLVQNGRDLEQIPAAQYGYNADSIAICVSGSRSFTEESLKSLVSLCNSIATAYKQNITFHGHCEVSSKTCPVFDYKKVLQLDSEGYINICENSKILVSKAKDLLKPESNLIADGELTEESTLSNLELIKKEFESEDAWQRRWRPSIGYSLAITLPIFIMGLLTMMFIAMIRGGEYINGVSNIIINSSGILMSIFGGWFAAIGVIGYGRSAEKQQRIKFLGK